MSQEAENAAAGKKEESAVRQPARSDCDSSRRALLGGEGAIGRRLDHITIERRGGACRLYCSKGNVERETAALDCDAHLHHNKSCCWTRSLHLQKSYVAIGVGRVGLCLFGRDAACHLEQVAFAFDPEMLLFICQLLYPLPAWNLARRGDVSRRRPPCGRPTDAGPTSRPTVRRMG
ncbi:hypothetical protein BHE74_00052051 [Ensete ventricosum]|nr:hypothetical protein BHE74_00052051 [Ensete ventricosum]